MTRAVLPLTAVAGAMALPPSASAVTKTFDGSTDNDRNTGANWTSGADTSPGVPTTDDDVVIPSGRSASLSRAIDLL